MVQVMHKSPDQGRKVYTNVGVGTVVGQNEAATHYYVEQRDGSIKPVSRASARFQIAKGAAQTYARVEGTMTSTGRKCLGVDDTITHALAGGDPTTYEMICKDNKIKYRRYAEFNPGMQRMIIGNILRGKLRKGQPVVLDGETLIVRDVA